MRPLASITLLSAGLALAGCVEKVTVDTSVLTSFRVNIPAHNVTMADGTPYPYSKTPTPFTITIEPINGLGETLMSWSGRVRVTSVPGDIGSKGAGILVDIANGGAMVDVGIAYGFGQTRIWVEDIGTADTLGTFATGISEPIFFAEPTIRTINESTSTIDSPFEGELVNITLGTMVVTHITSSGFYVTDLDDTEFNSVYVYARAYAEELARGDAVTRLTGSVQEYLGFTELNNPSWVPGSFVGVPEPVQLECESIGQCPGGYEGNVQARCLDAEKHESSFIELHDLVIEVCPQYPNCPDFTQYGQWTASLPCEGRITVITRFTVPDLDPIADKGKTISSLRGILKQVQYATPQWIVEPRDNMDIDCAECAGLRN